MPFTFRDDGYFNMTKAAQQFGKDVFEFTRLPSTKEYVEALTGIFPDKEMIRVQRGSGLLPQVGTWAHPKLAVFFARWLDVRFAVWCDAMIEDILTKKADVVVTQPETSAVVQATQQFGNMDIMSALAQFMVASTEQTKLLASRQQDQDKELKKIQADVTYTKEYVESLSLFFRDKKIIVVQRGSGLLPQVGTELEYSRSDY